MRQAKSGDTVRVHYTGTLGDGTQFDSSAERGPIEVSLGVGQVVPGFENAVMGMAEGESKTVTLDPKDAYGQRDSQLVHVVERERLPAEIEIHVGATLQASDGEGNQMRLVVVEFDEANVTMDANHPLAGQALTFDLTLVEFVG